MSTTATKIFTVVLLLMSSIAVINGTQLFGFTPGVTPSEFSLNYVTTIGLRLGLYFALIAIAEQMILSQDGNNSLYFKTGWFVYIGGVALCFPLAGPGMDIVRLHVPGLFMPLLVLLPLMLLAFIAPLFVMHVCGFFFWKDKDRIAATKGDIQAPAGGLMVFSYLTLVLSLIVEIYVEAFRLEAIILAAFCSAMIVLGSVQFAKVACATESYHDLSAEIKKKPLMVSHSLLFAGVIALVSSISFYFSGKFPDVPGIVVLGAILHLIATVIVSSRSSTIYIARHLRKLDEEHAQTFKNKVGAP